MAESDALGMRPGGVCSSMLHPVSFTPAFFLQLFRTALVTVTLFQATIHILDGAGGVTHRPGNKKMEKLVLAILMSVVVLCSQPSVNKA